MVTQTALRLNLSCKAVTFCREYKIDISFTEVYNFFASVIKVMCPLIAIIKEKSMAVCSFLSHESIYDADVEDRLQTAADQVVNENESVEFLLNYKCESIDRRRINC